MSYLGTLILTVFSLSKILNANFLNQDSNLDVLTKTLFDNLHLDPRAKDNEFLTKQAKDIIDKQIENYLDLVARTPSIAVRKSKRSLPSDSLESITRDEKGVHFLRNILPFQRSSPSFSGKVELFYQYGNWYALLEEFSNVKKSHSDLVIYKFTNEQFLKLSRLHLTDGALSGTFKLHEDNYLLLRESFPNKVSNLYKFNKAEKLEFIQNLGSISHVHFWTATGDIFMGVVNKNVSNVVIYKWFGRHFDMVQEIHSPSALRIASIEINYKHFLAITNSNTANGTSEFLEIYSFSHDKNAYELQQRLKTSSCNDARFFTISKNFTTDAFLAVANEFEIDQDGHKNYETSSIIYKYVDGYFLPFQDISLSGAKGFSVVKGCREEFVLIAISLFEKPRYYQYNGWNFQEVVLEPNPLKEGISDLYSYNFDGNRTILVVNFDDTRQNGDRMFLAEFEQTNQLQQYHDDMLKWCQSELQNDWGLQRRKRATIEETNVAGISSPELPKDIETRVDGYLEEINEIEVKLFNSLQSEATHTIDFDLSANNIIFRNITSIQNLITSSVNNITVDNSISQSINIMEDSEVDHLEFKQITLDGHISLNNINGNPHQNLLRNSPSDLNIENLVINGRASTDRDIKTSTINGMIFDDKHILLKSQDQQLDSLIINGSIWTETLKTNYLNGVKMTELARETPEVIHINNLTDLRVKNLIIRGFINDVYVPALEQYSLKSIGNQEINASYIFEEIEAKNLLALTVSNRRIPEDVILTTWGDYTVRQAVHFSKVLTVNHLEAKQHMDAIPVKLGKLEALLKSSDSVQHVTAPKQIQSVRLQNGIGLRGQLHSSQLEKINPVVNIFDPAILVSDLTFIGNVTIEKLIVRDITTDDGLYSLQKLGDRGLRLDDTEIDVKMEMLQQLNVIEIFVDSINDVNPDFWVENGGKQPQIVNGSKLLKGDLFITGDTSVFKINNIDVSELEDTALYKTGDQIITGRHFIEGVIADQIRASNIKIGKTIWEDKILMDADQVILGTTTVKGSVKAENVTSNNMKIEGLINNLNFNEIVDDTVTAEGNKSITGHKTFTSLSVGDLVLTSGLHLENISKNSDVTITKSVEMGEPWIENIYFMKNYNGIGNAELQNSDASEAEIIYEDLEFEEMTIPGDVFIRSNYINGLNLTELAEKTIKTDEPFAFSKFVINDDVESEGIVFVQGNILNLDLDNLVHSDMEEDQTVYAEKTFINSLIVQGNVYFNGLINGMNYSNICEFMDVTKLKNLTIMGNAYFSKGPHVYSINKNKVETILAQAWLKDAAVELADVEFKNVTFLKAISISGLIDGVNMSDLNLNYFSKSKNQTIFNSIEFSDVIFQNNLITPEIYANGPVNDIKIDEFYQTVLQDNADQVFEDAIYLENCYAEEIRGDYLVNNLNLENKVMRYDTMNVVTGTKRINHLDSILLTLDRRTKIQNVDVLYWMEDAILKDGDFSIQAPKIIKGSTLFENGFSSKVPINGVVFSKDAIMLKSSAQNVTGKKTFVSKPTAPTKFKDLKMKGKINEVDLVKLMEVQAYKNQDNTFRTPINFHKALEAENLVFDKLYQGVNVDQLIRNVSKLERLTNMSNTFVDLMGASKKLSWYLDNQAYFFDYFRVSHVIANAYESVHLLCDQNTWELIAFSKFNSTNMVEHYAWDDHELKLALTGEVVQMDLYPYIEKVTLGSNQFAYLEDGLPEMSLVKGGHVGRLYEAKCSTPLQNFIRLPSNGTIFAESLEIPEINQFCVLFIYQLGFKPTVFCDKNGELHHYQTLDQLNAISATTVPINGKTAVIFLTQALDRKESTVAIWSLRNGTIFELDQEVYAVEPISVSTVTYRDELYMAMAMGQMEGVMQTGRVELWRYIDTEQQFILWDTLNLAAPIQVEFTLLPSNELMLYVATNTPTEPLVIYQYEGVSGFIRKMVASSIPRIFALKPFTVANGHFIVAQGHNEVYILQAVFKGNRHVEN